LATLVDTDFEDLQNNLEKFQKILKNLKYLITYSGDRVLHSIHRIKISSSKFW